LPTNPGPVQKQKSWILLAATAFLLLAVAAIIGLGILYSPAGNPPVPFSTAAIEQTARGSLPAWLNVYFTEPTSQGNPNQGIDEVFLPAVDNARSSIDLASFDLNLPSLIDALVNARRRGVTVRVVYDGANGSLSLENAAPGNQPFDTLKILKAGGIQTVDGGRSYGIMHDKILLVDGSLLFVGSLNFSFNDTYRNNNNLLKITDSTLIRNYQAKFNEMFVDRRFGTNAHVRALVPALSIAGVQVENYFSPPDHVMEKLIAYVESAKSKIHFMAFTFTDANLAAAMLDRSRAGLDVQGVMESRNADLESVLPLLCKKIPLQLDGNRYNMHHKVIVIDSETVITGSFNFTKSADDSNDENVLVIHNKAVAALFEQEFQKMQRSANPCSN
jgi:phosphatidylserine/phosphatidylglycerophosphate/cardiolipin synthase-like enzyme